MQASTSVNGPRFPQKGFASASFPKQTESTDMLSRSWPKAYHECRGFTFQNQDRVLKVDICKLGDANIYHHKGEVVKCRMSYYVLLHPPTRSLL